jgi:hypothetical protein
MSEDQIAAQLKQNIPAPPDPTLPSPIPISTDEQSSNISDQLEDFMLFKVANLLEARYLPQDLEQNNKLKFIYSQASELSGSNELEVITATIKDLLVREGISHAEDRLRKLYLWMKLNQEWLKVMRENKDDNGR